MNVIINGISYPNAQWSEPIMAIETDMTLNEIAAAFAPGMNTDIIIMDGDQEIAKYYNKGIESIKVSGNNPRTVEVTFDLTKIAANAETEIRASLDTSDDAIAELGTMIAEIFSYNIPALYDEIKSHFTNMLREENGALNQINIRLSALEHEVGIVSIAPTEEADDNG